MYKDMLRAAAGNRVQIPDDGLVAWYDLSDISTLYQDESGTTPVTADGQTIKRINDKSGNGHDLTSSTGAPYDASDKSVDLRGLSVGFQSPASVDLTAHSQMTAVVAVRKDSDTFGVLFGQGDSRDTDDGWEIAMGSGSPTANREDYRIQLNKGGAGNLETETNYPAPVSNVFYVSADVTGDTFEARYPDIRVDGTESRGENNLNNLTSTTGLFDQPIDLGSRENASAYADAKIYGVILYSRLLDTDERELVETYMMDKI